MRPVCFAILLLLAAVGMPARAADVNRCVDASGHPVFTDKHCEDVGASVRIDPVPVATGATGSANPIRVHVRDCAHTTEDLRRGLQAALATGDVNKVAGFYHWAGATTASSENVLTRLQAIAARPVLALELIRPHQAPDSEGYTTVASTQEFAASAIELVQSRSANDPTQVRTTLALTAYMGCWWVRF
jgi:hypothetical protein